MKNLIQYAPAFVAVGCKLDYSTKDNTLDIAEIPKEKITKKVVEAAAKDIELFEDTANFQDGLSVVALADYIDGEINPLSQDARENILTNIKMMKDGRFIRQSLHLAKVNKSWHVSDIPNECSYFGEYCTHRGTETGGGRTETRGRKSYREPDEYHVKTSRGIGREQLVTPNIQGLYDHIPMSKLISLSDRTPITPLIQRIEGMDREQLVEVMARVQKVLNQSNTEIEAPVVKEKVK